jgi:chorismate mutase
MDWSTAVSELLKLALAIAVPFGLVALGKLAVAALNAANTYMDKHDLGVAETLARAAITTAEAKLKDVSGAERMEWVLDYLDSRGLHVDETEAEAIFQALNKAWKAEQAAATPEPATAPTATTMEVTPDA